MKKNFLFKKSLLGGLIVVFSIIGIFYACSKKDVLTLTERQEKAVSNDANKPEVNDRLSKKLFLQDFNFIGEKHNEGLDFVLKEILAQKRAGYKTKIDLDFIINASLKFAKQQKGLKGVLKDFENIKIRYKENISRLSNIGYREYLLQDDRLTDEQKKYALALLDLKPVTYASFHDQVLSILKDVQNSDLSIEEQKPLFSMASVGLYSTQYWLNKASLWKKVLNISPEGLENNILIDNVSFDVYQFVKWDQIGLRIGGLFAPIEGGAIIGAIIGSGANAIIQLSKKQR